MLRRLWLAPLNLQLEVALPGNAMRIGRFPPDCEGAANRPERQGDVASTIGVAVIATSPTHLLSDGNRHSFRSSTSSRAFQIVANMYDQ